MRSKIPTPNGSSKNIVSFPFTLSMGIEKGDCFLTIALNLMTEYEVTSKKFCCLKVKTVDITVFFKKFCITIRTIFCKSRSH